jgi:hypothetical protein
MRSRALIPFAVMLMVTSPAVAFASDGASQGIILGIGVATLLASVVLLLIALGLARVADGSAMADNISYVVGACVCLAASVLATWSVTLVADPVVADQIALGGSALNAVSIVLFCVYFYRVRAALRRFLKVVHTDDMLARAQAPDEGAGGTR